MSFKNVVGLDMKSTHLYKYLFSNTQYDVVLNPMEEQPGFFIN